ncbi:DUF3987 domain-containing protein [Carboxylicivirga sediminis]|uniref:DUF3987 domain-containing protein n=1 Tax=Carboxylicivirga sediminis TaxID=2006564 RepID=A0A941IYT1_9BACT|nr:DUF3987 domain-containing protein [Carboxylicivirga sediminis]MBR8536112.1 DUF3987 domain-containing protein [Carboxylicivirga sediminis]
MKSIENDKTELGKAHLTYGKLSLEEANVRLKQEGESEFPLSIFPRFIQNTILELYDNGNYNIDYTAVSILTALAGIIGNSYHLRKHIEWIENPSMWVVLVGKSGQNKSAPLKTAFKAVKNQQKQFDKEYEAAVANFDPDAGDKKPIKRKLYSTDPTFEALINMHKQNPNGMILMPDEFKSFILNLIGYSGTSKQSQFLSIWDGAPISLDRKEVESSSLSMPCVSIIGSIQDDVIASFKAKDIKDGFFERILFAIPLKMEKKYIQRKNPDDYMVEKFHTRMKALMDKVYENMGTIELSLSETAEVLFIDEVNKHVKPSNKDATISGILSKLDRYILRFALILEVSNSFFEGQPIKHITMDSMKKAIMLKDYFYVNALKLNNMVLNVYEDNSKEGKVLQVIKKIGKKEFTNKEFIQMADHMGIAKESYAYQLLSNTKLAHKVQKGVYETEILN